jgi:DNA-binding NarL/FixJ family response regulator
VDHHDEGQDRPTPALAGVVVAYEDLVRHRVVSMLSAAMLAVSWHGRSLDREALRGVSGQFAVLSADVAHDAGIDLIRSTRALLPSQPIVAISASAAPAGASRALRAGANGIVLDAQAHEALIPTIRAVHAGQIVLPRGSQRIEPPRLSQREKQTLALVIIGFSNAEVARRLFVSESTVKSHLTSAFRKLGVRSRGQAADLILDPQTGLGTGILTITGGEHRRRAPGR